MTEKTHKTLDTAIDSALKKVSKSIEEHGIPERLAHEITGNLVRYCLHEGKRIQDLKMFEILFYMDITMIKNGIDDGTIKGLDKYKHLF
jgi:argininosuccinate lyase